MKREDWPFASAAAPRKRRRKPSTLKWVLFEKDDESPPLLFLLLFTTSFLIGGCHDDEKGVTHSVTIGPASRAVGGGVVTKRTNPKLRDGWREVGRGTHTNRPLNDEKAWSTGIFALVDLRAPLRWPARKRSSRSFIPLHFKIKFVGLAKCASSAVNRLVYAAKNDVVLLFTVLNSHVVQHNIEWRSSVHVLSTVVVF